MSMRISARNSSTASLQLLQNDRADVCSPEDPSTETYGMGPMSAGSDDEKPTGVGSDIPRDEVLPFSWSPAEERAVLRKIDIRVPLILGVLYAVALIDRTNISLGVLAGAGYSLKLIGPNGHDHYNVALLSFFVTYIICDLPAQFILKRIGPRYWLSFLALAWGIATLAQGFVINYKQLALTRALCGAFEAGFFPGAIWLLSGWYTRKDIVLRVAQFWMLSLLAAGHAGILGWGFIQMDGLAGLAGWQWLWILEGVLTVVVALIAYFVIDGFPTEAKWITERERQIVLARLSAEREGILDQLTATSILKHCRDFKPWAFSVCFLCSTMPAYCFAFYAALLISDLGYDVRTTLLLNIPLQAVAAIYTAAIALTSYKINKRAPCIAVSASLSIIGLCMMLSGHKHVKLGGMYLGVSGCSANIVLTLAYHASNTRGHSKTGFGTALLVSFGAIGGLIASSVSFNDTTGLWIALALQILLLTIVGGLSITFFIHNRQARAGSRLIEGCLDYTYMI